MERTLEELLEGAPACQDCGKDWCGASCGRFIQLNEFQDQRENADWKATALRWHGKAADRLTEIQQLKRRIAVTDDLLKALKDIVQDLEIRAVDKVVNCGNGVYIRALQAIAKAEGKEEAS